MVGLVSSERNESDNESMLGLVGVGLEIEVLRGLPLIRMVQSIAAIIIITGLNLSVSKGLR